MASDPLSLPQDGVAAEILIIDDDASVRDMLSIYLRTKGFPVHAVGDGPSGMARCNAQLPGLVLCDLRMPGMDGLDVLAALNRDFPDLPVLVISGTGDMDDAIQALKLGAWDYITKPIEDFAVLDHALGKALERARLVVENRAYREHLEAMNEKLAHSLKQLEEDEACARKIQFALLPQRQVAFADFRCSRYLATSAILSGDFIDYFTIDEDRFGFYMADVSGHGVSSAVITVLLKSYVGRYLENHRRYGDRTILDPAGLLTALNHDILVGQHGKYLTMFYGVVTLSASQLEFANGGQFPSPLLFDGQAVTSIGGRSQPVGLFETVRYGNQRLVIPPRFALRIFSDGVLELLPVTGLEARKQALNEMAAEDVRDAEQLAQALGMDTQRDLPDDASILSIRRQAAHG